MSIRPETPYEMCGRMLSFLDELEQGKDFDAAAQAAGAEDLDELIHWAEKMEQSAAGLLAVVEVPKGFPIVVALFYPHQREEALLHFMKAVYRYTNSLGDAEGDIESYAERKKYVNDKVVVALVEAEDGLKRYSEVV